VGQNQVRAARSGPQGFSLLEMMVVVLIIIVLLAAAVPSVTRIAQNYRIAGDARAIAAELNLARLSAASSGSKSRLNVNLATNTYQIEVWNKPAGPYQVQGGVQSLSQGNVFGFGPATAPAGAQSAIAQGYPGEAGCGCIYFNSRGLVTDANGIATPDSAIYITNGQLVTAVTVSIAGQTTAYVRSGSAWGHL
jgi:prepilin-type N-terminal cleavage/methylation domain-containing protein